MFITELRTGRHEITVCVQLQRVADLKQFNKISAAMSLPFNDGTYFARRIKSLFVFNCKVQ
jgi:hypothetical protein